MTKIDDTGKAAVDRNYYWNEDMETCPQGVKVQLLPTTGCAYYGQWNGKGAHLFKGWAPLPKLRRKKGGEA